MAIFGKAKTGHLPTTKKRLFRYFSTCIIPLLLVLIVLSSHPLSLPPFNRNEKMQTVPEALARSNATLLEDPLRIYMYNLDPDFNWGMLWEKGRPTVPVEGQGVFDGDICPNKSSRYWDFRGKSGKFRARMPVYAGNPLVQQFSAEYFLTLSLLQGLPSIRRVDQPGEAQLFFVPFFASLSYNRDRKKPEVELKRQLDFMNWLSEQPYWKKSGGGDHVVVTHHPTSLGTQLQRLNSTILVVADFSRPKSQGSYVEKDVVAPYIPFVSPLWKEWDSKSSWEKRRTLVFFQGGFKRKKGGYIRQKLKEVLGGEKGVVLLEGKPNKRSIPEAQERLRKSKFCLMPAGDTPSSCRLYDSIQSLCVPVIISQAIELPFEDVFDYSKFTVLMPTYKALTKGYLVSYLRNITMEQWGDMHKNLREVRMHFLYSHPAKPGGAEDMIWQALYRKIAKYHSGSFRDKRRLIQEVESDPPEKYIW